MRRRSRRGALRVGLAILGLALGIAGVWAHASAALANPDGSPAPSFSGTTIDGDPVALDSYHGKPLVLLFWGSW
jgi:hypothetical protein